MVEEEIAKEKAAIAAEKVGLTGEGNSTRCHGLRRDCGIGAIIDSNLSGTLDDVAQETLLVAQNAAAKTSEWQRRPEARH